MLVERRLAACAVTIPGATSGDRRQGAIETGRERGMSAETRAELAATLAESPPSEVPAIPTLPIAAARVRGAWMEGETAQE